MLREIKDQPSSKTPVVLNSTVTRGSNVLHVKKKTITTHNSLYVTQHAGRSVSLPNLMMKEIIRNIDLNFRFISFERCGEFELQLLILFFVKSIISDMHHRITYMYINFQQNQGCNQSKPCTLIICTIYIASCTNLQLPIVFFFKWITSDMRLRKTYM